MGVKDLWNILSPLCERKPMFELQGKTIAIDLSCWVVDSQTVTDKSVQPKMYLRNLYFRTAFLLMQGIAPVFVLEGKAPTLKHNTIAKRNNIRNGFHERKTNRKGGRSQFNRILNECKEMLKLMGLACVQGHGEAEAMCAYLNEDGLVDGCISQDSDCFLYGARVVYRNFCTSAQGNRGGTGGAVDEYTMEKIENLLNLGRNKMIALALLCGCDYSDGLNGVGKEAALKLFKIVEDEHVLQRMKEWKTDDSLDRKESEVLNPNICTSCGHNGKVQKHTKYGCTDCGTVLKCNDSYREKRALILNEVALRKKALLVEDFPSQELIEEFLIRKDPVPTKLDLQWKQPEINKFIEYMERHLTWEPQYAFEKIFPLVTRWQLTHLPNISCDMRLSIPNLFLPDSIKKIRNIRSVAGYEIVWKTEHDIVERLKEYIAADKESDDEDNDNILSELTSIEPQNAVLRCYPELVEAFENMRSAKTKKRTVKSRVQKKTANPEDPAKDKPEKPKPREKKAPKKNIQLKNNRKIEEFVTMNCPLSLEKSFEMMSITPKRSKKTSEQNVNAGTSDVQLKRGPQFDNVLQVEKLNVKLNNTLDRMFNELSPDDFISDTDNNDLNMTEIIENICSNSIFKFNTKSVEAPATENEISTISSENIKTNTKSVADVRNSSQCMQKDVTHIESADEFDNINESYVPLNQRLLNCEITPNLQKGCIGGTAKFSLGFNDLMNDTDPENTLV